MGSPISSVDYCDEDHKLWSKVYKILRSLSRENAIKEYNQGIQELEKNKIFEEDKIPDL